jgi:hypothetical protein
MTLINFTAMNLGLIVTAKITRFTKMKIYTNLTRKPDMVILKIGLNSFIQIKNIQIQFQK